MIVRIAGEGQYDIADDALDSLNPLDDAIEQALESGDEEQFRTNLTSLLEQVRSLGTLVGDDVLVPSDLLLPHADSTVAEVRELLGDEGLIPG
jgi:hypothetical protein